MMLEAKSVRRFGAEIELNCLKVKSEPGCPWVVRADDGDGIYHVGQLVVNTLGEGVQVKKYGQTHNNDCWVLKPDSSCGLELVTPVMRGWHGLCRLIKVISAIRDNPEIEIDDRCSLHVHAEVSDLTARNLAWVLGWWVKCEAVFLDAMPTSRKKNKYCQFLGMLPEFSFDRTMSPEEMICYFGSYKYGSMNTLNLFKGLRPTVEVRIGDQELCCDPYGVKNWIRLVLHFIDMASKKPLDFNYKKGDVMSSWHWLDPKDVFALLGFDGDLSPGLAQVRDWFIGRLCRYTAAPNCTGYMGLSARRASLDQARDMLDNRKLWAKDLLSPPNLEEALYGKIYQV